NYDAARSISVTVTFDATRGVCWLTVGAQQASRAVSNVHRGQITHKGVADILVTLPQALQLGHYDRDVVPVFLLSL
ncbi:MAG: hypothetical protein ACLFVA_06630, partial [Dehalococcoidia bacterium]